MNGRLLLTTLLLYLLPLICFSQVTEVGYVMQYNGKESKTAISDVEIQVQKAQSTITDSLGYFELVFPTQKAGNEVAVSEIYKSGYIIFNNDVVKGWRISDNRTPFVIVMCLENQFRELKKKYYGIIEKSYKEDYEREKIKLLESNLEAEMLKTQLMNLENNYRQKLSNINSYVEIFSRIDLSEMSSIEADALRLIEENKIEEGIRKYEELQLRNKVNEQLEKLQSANQIVQAGKTIQEETLNDLLTLAEKLKTQIGMYDVGGEEYREKKRETISQLIGIYQNLRTAIGNTYNNELGYWMIQYASFVYEPSKYIELVNQAASLPSYEGLAELGRMYEYRSVFDSSLDEKARECYREAIGLMEVADSNCFAAKRLKMLPDFSCEYSGTPIYYRILSEKERTVAICSKNLMVHNAPQGKFEMPPYVKHKGVKYSVVKIDDEAFYHDRLLTGVSIPKSIKSIGEDAFSGTSISELVCYSDVNTEDICIEPIKHLMEDDSQPSNNNYLLHIINLVQACAKIEMEKGFDKNATSFPEYEELLSIGIIAAQAIVKNKDRQELKKYNDGYFMTAINWAIHNELKFRYSWHHYFDINYNDLVGTYPDYDKTIVRVSLYQSIWDLYYIMRNQAIEHISPFAFNAGEQIEKFIEETPNSLEKKCVKLAVVDKMTPADAAKLLNISVEIYFSSLIAALNSIREKIQPENLEKYLDNEPPPSDVYLNTQNSTIENHLSRINLISRIVGTVWYYYHKQTDLPCTEVGEYIEMTINAMSSVFKDNSKNLSSKPDIFWETAFSEVVEKELEYKYKGIYQGGIMNPNGLSTPIKKGYHKINLDERSREVACVAYLAKAMEDSDAVLKITHNTEKSADSLSLQYEVLPRLSAQYQKIKSYIQNIEDKNEHRIMEDFFINCLFNVGYKKVYDSFKLLDKHIEALSILLNEDVEDIVLADFQEQYAGSYWQGGELTTGENYLCCALKKYEKAFESNPSLQQRVMELRNELIQVKWAVAKYEEALEIAQKNIETEDNEENRWFFAYCYNMMALSKYAPDNDYENAIGAIDKAIEILPSEANLYDTKGEIFLMQGKKQEALQMWKKVLELSPDFLKHYPEGTNLSNGLKKQELK